MGIDARAIAGRLADARFSGSYRDESDLHPDLLQALTDAAGPAALVHVERQTPGVIRSVSAFARSWRPNAAIELPDRKIGVEAKLLRRTHESGSIATAILQGMILGLEFDEALLVLVATEDAAAFTPRERAMLDRLWDFGRIAWASVTAKGMVEEAEPAAGRVPGEQATRGSRKWIQRAVNDYPNVLARAIAEASAGQIRGPIRWKSPLRHDGFAEYRDERALKLIGADLARRPLASFWPSGGPRWDALGVLDDGTLILVEAKARLGEEASALRATDPRSRELIATSLAETRAALGARDGADWTESYSQYANRLAHLHLLRDLNGLPAWLVFVSFAGDEEAGAPRREDFERVRREIHAKLGLGPHDVPGVIHATVGTNELGAVTTGAPARDTVI